MAGPWEKYGQPQGVQTKPAQAPEPKFIPGAPGYTLNQQGSAQAIPGLPPEPPKKVEPTFIPGVPGVVMGPGNTAVPITGLPPKDAATDQNSSATRANAIAGYGYAEQLQSVIDDLNAKFSAGPGSTQGVRGVNDYLPLTVNQQFDTTANAARGIIGQTLGFTGGQLNTPREAEAAIGPYLPQAGDRDEVIKGKIKSLNDLAEMARKRAIMTLGGVPDANGNVTPVKPEQMDRSSPLVAGEPGPGQATLTQDGTRDEIDPILRATGTRLGKMVSNGATRAQIDKFLNESGLHPETDPKLRASVNETLRFRNTPQFKAWQRGNPGKSYPIDPGFYTRKAPLTETEAKRNHEAQTPGGAFVIGAASGLTGNRLDNMAGALGGNPEEVRTAQMLNQSQNPGMSMAGDLAGQVGFEYLAGRIPVVRGLAATKWGQRGVDAGYGAYAGSGQSDDNQGMGALTGAGINVLGGGIGRNGQRGLAGLTRGANPGSSLAYLNDAGVPLTVGQMGRGTESVSGNIIGGIEDRLAGLPISDAIIGAARRRGDQGFNAAAFREGGGSGLTGSSGVTELKGLQDKAYSFLDGVNFPIDAPFAGSQAGVRAAIPTMPSFGREVGMGLDKIDLASRGGALPGQDWQSAISATRGNRSSIAGQPFAQDATNALSGVEGNLMDLAARQGPPGTLDNLASANKGYGQFKTLVSALDNGPAQRADELFSASRLNDASRNNARGFGGRVASMEGKRPFYSLANAGMDVMPNLTPDSGTAGRSLFYAALPSILGGSAGAAYGGMSDDMTAGQGAAAGGGIGAMGTIAPAAILAALYSKTGQKGLQKLALGPRPKAITVIEDLMAKNPRLAALFGAKAAGNVGGALARNFGMYPELPQ